MNPITTVMLVFSCLGALDRILGNRFGLGKEFERGFMLLGPMSLSMIGMIVLSPYLAKLLAPCFEWFHQTLRMDPSILPASLFANDMGGASLAYEICTDDKMGAFNALVVSSMLGCTISFTIPYALGVVKKEHHKDLFFGLLCGIVTVPVGCILSGLFIGLPFLSLLWNLLPLLIIAILLAVCLFFFPNGTVKAFCLFGEFMKALITLGLVIGVIQFLTGKTLLVNLDTIQYGGEICLNAAVVLSGAFPMMYVVSKLLTKPMRALSKAWKVNETSAMGFVCSIVTNATTLEMTNRMDRKGIVLNSSFIVSAAFLFGSHLAFTMAMDPSYLAPVMIGKFISGLSAILLAVFMYDRVYKENKHQSLSQTSEVTK